MCLAAIFQIHLTVFNRHTRYIPDVQAHHCIGISMLPVALPTLGPILLP